MKKILVIEDELEMRRNIGALLRCNEYEPIAAEKGRLGVELARREKPDFSLCDVMMPELDGYGVLRALQAEAKLALIPFIFLRLKANGASRNGNGTSVQSQVEKSLRLEFPQVVTEAAEPEISERGEYHTRKKYPPLPSSASAQAGRALC